jgi:hypothetical protein
VELRLTNTVGIMRFRDMGYLGVDIVQNDLMLLKMKLVINEKKRA